MRLLPPDLLPIFGPDGVRISLCHPAWATAKGRGLAEHIKSEKGWEVHVPSYKEKILLD